MDSGKLFLSFFMSLQIILTTSTFSPMKIGKLLGKGRLVKPRNCSIHRSAVVRKLLHENFFPVFEKYGVEVPKRCKFHKDRDLFIAIEENKSDEGLAWKCELCGKQFYELYHFYEHAKRKHSNVFVTGNDAVCLAKYCDIFRCDLHEKYPHDIPSSVPCENKTVDQLRRKCEALARSCLPDEMFHTIYDKVYTALCSTLTCEKFLQPFQDSVSVLMVVVLSICIPIVLFFIVQCCVIYCDTSYDPDDDEKYRLAKRAEYDARNCEYNQRYHFMRQGGYSVRQRAPSRLNKYNKYQRISH